MSTDTEMESLVSQTGADQTDASAGGSIGQAASWNASHPLSRHLNALASAPGTARISMAVGELATVIDQAAGDAPASVGITALKATHNLGLTAVTLAALWGKWGRPTCLIDLGSGRKSITGAVASTRPDLAGACQQAKAGELDGLAGLHAQIPRSAMIGVGNAEVLGLLSTGALTMLVNSLKKRFDRIVIAAPAVDTSFPVLGLHKCCDRVVMSLVRGKSRGGAVRELAEQSMVLGLRPLDAIWYD